jgi:ubiquinone/menaquinone biosynthesis C-methylase UbiE
MRRRIIGQFKHPHGVLGRLAGWIMANRESNLLRNEWAVSLLEIEPTHKVLELGCGPGVALEHAAKHASSGLVVGVDHSELMLRASARRNAEAIAAGRVELRLGTAETMADEDRRFDRVLAVNVVQFWDAPVGTLRTLRGLMTSGGRVAIALQPRNKGATNGDSERAAQRNLALLEEAGFRDLRVERLELAPTATCVLGLA